MDLPAVVDGDRVIPALLEGLPIDIVGDGEFRRGTITLPLARIALTKTAKIPSRVCVRRDEQHQRHQFGLEWQAESQGLPHLLEVERVEENDRFNGNFGQGLENLSFVGGGVLAGGAQRSIFRNLRIFRHPKDGFVIGRGSTRCSLYDIDLSNHRGTDPYTVAATGFFLHGSGSITGSGLSSMGHKLGMHVHKSHCVTIHGFACELDLVALKVDGNSSGIRIHGAELQSVGAIPIDLTQNGGGIHIDGVVRKSPQVFNGGAVGPGVWVKNFKGDPVKLFGDATSSNGYPFTLETRGYGSDQELWRDGRRIDPPPAATPPGGGLQPGDKMKLVVEEIEAGETPS